MTVLEAYKKILVYGGGELVGDGLLKIPFVEALRQAFPKASITWLSGDFKSVYESNLASLVQNKLNTVLYVPKTEGLKKAFEGKTFDLVIDTQKDWRTTLRLKHALKCHAFYSAALKYYLSDFKPPKGYKPPQRLVDQLLDILKILGIRDISKTFPISLDLSWDKKAQALLPGSGPYLGLVPGAGYRGKCWPLESYLHLGQWAQTQGLTPVIFLGPQEKDWYEICRTVLPHAIYPLQEASSAVMSPLLTIALGKRVQVAVSNDCGTGHMLAAADVPLISLFGVTSAEKFAPCVTQGIILKAQDFGGVALKDIPQEAVQGAVLCLLSRGRAIGG